MPKHNRLRLRRGRVAASLLDAALPGPVDDEGLVDVDIEIAGGMVTAIAPAGSFPVSEALDLDQGQVWPTFADLHTHLDIGHNWPRAPNPDGSFAGAVAAAAADHDVQWPTGDVLRRFEFGLCCAFAHGVGAIRTHLDSKPREAAAHWAAFRTLRDRWAGRIDLQATSLVPMDFFGTDFGAELADLVARSGGQLGAVARIVEGDHPAGSPKFLELLEGIFELAEARGLDLDFHVDESGETGARALGFIARMALRRRFKGKILCGHCCSLAIQPDEVIEETLVACAEAGIAVVSLPMCNLYLQDRVPGRTPRWRGVTLLHEIAAHGIEVSVANDDCRNAFYGFGDQDMVEVFTQAVRIAHLDRPYGNWPRAVTATPAGVMKLKGRGVVRIGGPADLVLFKARRMSELLSRPQSDRVVLRGGQGIDTTLPDYRELDDLQRQVG